MDRDALSAKLREWVAHDVLQREQADAVWAYEATLPAPDALGAPATAAPSAGPRPALRIPVLGEVLGYVGGTLSLTALAALVFQSWDVLGTPGQIGTAALVAAVCIGAGWLVSTNDSPAARRLSSFLLFFGTGAAGFLFGLIADKSLGTVHRDSWPISQLPQIAACGAALVIGSAIWWLRRTPLQLIALTLALAGFIAASWDYTLSNSSTDVGTIYVVLGIVWIVVAELGWLKPQGTATSLGCLGVLAGIQMIGLTQDSSSGSGGIYLLGAVAGLALIGLALWRRRGIPLGFGAAAIVIFLPQLLSTVFHESVGITLSLLFAGVLLVVMSIFVIRMRPKLGGRSEGAAPAPR